jgi:hypothetical protein
MMRNLSVVFLSAFLISSGIAQAGEYAGYTMEDCGLAEGASTMTPDMRLFSLSIYRQGRYKSVISRMNVEDKFEDWRDFGYESLGSERVDLVLPKSFSQGRRIAVHLGGAFAHRGDFIRINEAGEGVNTFPETDLKVWLGFALKFRKHTSVGYRTSFIRVKLPIEDGYDYGRGFSHDLGIFHRIGGESAPYLMDVYLGVTDLSNGLSFKDPDLPDRLRRTYRLRIVKAFQPLDFPFTVELDLRAPWRFGPRFGLTFFTNWGDRWRFGLGYVRETRKAGDRFWMMKGPALTVIFRAKKLDLSAAFYPQWHPAPFSFERVRVEDFSPRISFGLLRRF